MSNPYAPPKAAVHDIPPAPTGIVPADRGTRLGAAILDGFVFMLMVYVPFTAAVAASALASEPASLSIFMGAFFVALAGLALWCVITIRSLKRTGQSIAKKIVGIKVVRSDGSPASVARIIWLRNAANILLGVVPINGIVDTLFIFSESRQCLHDKIADTIVVNA